jgi:hypothetical protein
MENSPSSLNKIKEFQTKIKKATKEALFIVALETFQVAAWVGIGLIYIFSPIIEKNKDKIIATIEAISKLKGKKKKKRESQ